jgi:hypothetical protein
MFLGVGVGAVMDHALAVAHLDLRAVFGWLQAIAVNNDAGLRDGADVGIPGAPLGGGRFRVGALRMVGRSFFEDEHELHGVFLRWNEPVRNCVGSLLRCAIRAPIDMKLKFSWKKFGGFK